MRCIAKGLRGSPLERLSYALMQGREVAAWSKSDSISCEITRFARRNENADDKNLIFFISIANSIHVHPQHTLARISIHIGANKPMPFGIIAPRLQVVIPRHLFIQACELSVFDCGADLENALHSTGQL